MTPEESWAINHFGGKCSLEGAEYDWRQGKILVGAISSLHQQAEALKAENERLKQLVPTEDDKRETREIIEAYGLKLKEAEAALAAKEKALDVMTSDYRDAAKELRAKEKDLAASVQAELKINEIASGLRKELADWLGTKGASIAADNLQLISELAECRRIGVEKLMDAQADSSLLRRRVEDLENQYRHTHEALYEPVGFGMELSEKCGKCGRNLRDNLHAQPQEPKS